VYNCLKTCLYALRSTLILISYIASHSSLGLCLMSSLLKGERLCIKLVELLLIRVSFVSFYVFDLFLALLYHFGLVYRFLCLLLVLRLFLLLHDLELLIGFCSSSCSSWGIGFEIHTVCLLLSMDSSRERLRNQVVSNLV
jgi:hypothetical protein